MKYEEILDVIVTLPTVFRCPDLSKVTGLPKSTASDYLKRLLKDGKLHRKKVNVNITLWSLSPFPEEATKKPLPRVFTAEEYGEYFNMKHSYKALYRAFAKGLVFKVGRNTNIQGYPLLWSFNKEDAKSEFLLNKAKASAIIPSEVKDPFANVFR